MTTATAQANPNLVSLSTQRKHTVELTARVILAANLSLADVLFSPDTQDKTDFLKTKVGFDALTAIYEKHLLIPMR